MNETIWLDSTTVDNYETTQAVAIPAPSDDRTEQGIIIGAAVGGACAFLIIILLLVLWIKYKRSNMNPPPTLPHPYALPRFECTEPTVSDHQSDVEAISGEHSKHLGSFQHTWQVQEPVIHSPTEFSESERISYILMGEPARPISISPPSPELVARGHKQATNKRAPPAACKSPSGYMNVTDKIAGQSPPSPGTLRTLTNFDTNETSMEELSTNGDINYPDNYENVEDVILPEKNNAPNQIILKETPANISLLGDEPVEQRLPDLLTGSFPNKNHTRAHLVQETAGHQDDDSSCDSETSASSHDAGFPVSYVNVDQFRKRSLVKELVTIDPSKSTFPELVNNKSSSESKHKTGTKPPSVTQKPASLIPKPSSVTQKSRSLIPKTKLTQQHRTTEADVEDTYQINADLVNIDKNSQDNVDKSRQDNIDKNKQDKLHQKHRKLSSPTQTKDDTNTSACRKISLPPTETPIDSATTKFLTTGRLHTKNQRKGAQGKLNHRQRSLSYQDEVGVYQNFPDISSSESTLSQLPASPTPANTKEIHSKPSRELDTASGLEITKPSLDPMEKRDQKEKTSSQQSRIPARLTKSPVRDVTLGSSLNIESSEEISKIRSNLRKVN